MPKEFEGLLEKERRVIDVKGNEGSVKEVVVREVGKLTEAKKGSVGGEGASL